MTNNETNNNTSNVLPVVEATATATATLNNVNVDVDNSTTGTSDRNSLWPKDSADLVQFTVPLSWVKGRGGSTVSTTNTDSDSTIICKLQYDPIQHYITIIDCITGTILDIIDIDDMIGSAIDINMNLEQTTTTTTTTTIKADKENENSTEETIDQQQQQRATNEPLVDTPIDRIGTATLTIYVYSRDDLSTPKKMKQTTTSTTTSSSWWSFRNLLSFSSLTSSSISNNQKQPQPEYIRPNNNVKTTTKFSNRYENHRILQLQPVDDFIHVRKIVTALQQLSSIPSSLPSLPSLQTKTNDEASSSLMTIPPSKQQISSKHYLIIVNPVSGPKKNGIIVCNTIVQPMLQQAGIETTIIITQYPNHAKDICSNNTNINNSTTSTTTTTGGNDNNTTTTNTNINIKNYNGIILIGGDGIVHEVLNGIYVRDDKDTIVQSIPIGIIGCGTSNGMIISLCYASNEYTCNNVDETFLICKGQYNTIDISQYSILVPNENKNSTTTTDGNTLTPPTTTSSSNTTSIKQYISNLTFTWAFVSDIDLESECIRWLGPLRYDIWAVLRIVSLRKYKAKFSYLPVMPTTGSTTSTSTEIPAITEPIPNNNSTPWITIDDTFVLLWISHVTHASPSVLIAPESKLNDGIFHVVLGRGSVSRYNLLRMVMLVENGTHSTVPGCEIIQCTAFRLESQSSTKNLSKSTATTTTTVSKKSSLSLSSSSYRTTKNNIDGEAVEDGIVQASIISNVVQMFHKG